MINPGLATNSASTAFWHTSTSSIANSFTTTSGVSAGGFNATFNISQWTADAANSRRVVAAALAVRYRGTELNRGGSVFGVMDPTHSSLANIGLTYDNFVSRYPLLEPRPVGRKWHMISWRPVREDELSFSNTLSNSANAATLGIMIKGPGNASSTPTPGAYEWRAIVRYEAQGPIVNRFAHSPCLADPVGFAAVLSAQTEYGVVEEPGFGQKLVGGVVRAGKLVVNAASGVGQALVENATPSTVQKVVRGTIKAVTGDHAGALADLASAAVSAGDVRVPEVTWHSMGSNKRELKHELR
jgi:hypothetical protein